MQAGAAFNTYYTPDPADLSKDIAPFLAWWSPGQYLVPGVIGLTGLKVGQAIAITAGLSLFAFLSGTAVLMRRFGQPPLAALLAVLFLAAFRFSSAPFSVYTGGEILILAALPWFVLASLRVPEGRLLPAAVIAFAVITLGFLAKLTGLVVGAAALTAACAPVLIAKRRLTPGMIGGVIGAGLAVALIYLFWLSRGETPGTVADGRINTGGVLLAIVAPWTAGTSLLDALSWVIIHPGRVIVRNVIPLIWMTAPLAALIAALVLFGRKDESLKRLTVYALIFYAVTSLVLIVLFLRGGDVGVEDRHVRPAGVLLFLCALASALQHRRLVALAFLSFFAAMSLYGAAAFAQRTLGTLRADRFEPVSGLNHMFVDRRAIEFVQAAYAREGRAALFVLAMPDVSLALPDQARTVTLTAAADVLRLETLHYEGSVPGSVYIVMQGRLVDKPKAMKIRSAFAAYPADGWAFQDFGDTRVYWQARP